MNKSWYFSKTIILAVLQGVAGVLLAILAQQPTLGWALVGKSVLDIILRNLTTTPIG